MVQSEKPGYVQGFTCPCGVEFSVRSYLNEVKAVTVAREHKCAESLDELARIFREEMPHEANFSKANAKWSLDPRSGLLEVLAPAGESSAPGATPQRGVSPEGGQVVSRPPQNTAPGLNPLPHQRTLNRLGRTSASDMSTLAVPQGPPRPPAVASWGTECDQRCSASRHFCHRPGNLAETTMTKLVYVGVDSLYWSAHAELADELLENLQLEKNRARDGERVVRELGGHYWQVSYGAGGRRHPFRLENEFAILGLAKKSKEGKTIKSLPAIKLTIRCEFMAEHGIKAAWEWCEAFAKKIHAGPGVPEEVLSRLDMCVDVVGVDFGSSDLNDFVMRARKTTRFRAGRTPEDLDGLAETFVRNYGTVFTNAEDDSRRLERELTKLATWRREARARTRLKQHVESWRKEKDRAAEDAARWAKVTAKSVLLAKRTDGEKREVDQEKMRQVLADALEAQAKAEARAAGEEENYETSEHFSARKLTGYMFGKGATSVRIYDKTREIREVSRHKVWLYDLWAKSGWVSTETVWRVEVQLRREALKELISRDTGAKLDLDKLGDAGLAEGETRAAGVPRAQGPTGVEAVSDSPPAPSAPVASGLLGALPSLWAYVVGGRRGHSAWIKWTVPSGKNRSRWEVRDEWKVIQGADWGPGAKEELLRFRVRRARYQALLGQWAGLGTKLAALRGLTTDGRIPDFYDMQGDADAYFERKGTNRETEVNEKRVEVALWDVAHHVGEDERAIKAAIKAAVEISGESNTTNSRAIAKKAWARARAEVGAA